ncbi:hypothetical protein R84B8_00818 [Treponema sp. R8-4-B8]
MRNEQEWELVYNPDFKTAEFDRFKSQSGNRKALKYTANCTIQLMLSAPLLKGLALAADCIHY